MNDRLLIKKLYKIAVALQRISVDSLADLAAITNPKSFEVRISDFGDLSLLSCASVEPSKTLRAGLLLKTAPLQKLTKNRHLSDRKIKTLTLNCVQCFVKFVNLNQVFVRS